jgi:hypothetical protein
LCSAAITRLAETIQMFLYDVLHYDDLGRFKRRIAPFINWRQLPVLKPGVF